MAVDAGGCGVRGHGRAVAGGRVDGDCAGGGGGGGEGGEEAEEEGWGVHFGKCWGGYEDGVGLVLVLVLVLWGVEVMKFLESWEKV